RSVDGGTGRECADVRVAMQEQETAGRVTQIVTLTVFSIVMFVPIGLMSVVAETPLFGFDPFDSAVVNRTLNYQLSALLVAGSALLLTFVFARKVRLRYL